MRIDVSMILKLLMNMIYLFYVGHLSIKFYNFFPIKIMSIFIYTYNSFVFDVANNDRSLFLYLMLLTMIDHYFKLYLLLLLVYRNAIYFLRKPYIPG